MNLSLRKIMNFKNADFKDGVLTMIPDENQMNHMTTIKLSYISK